VLLEEVRKLKEANEREQDVMIKRKKKENRSSDQRSSNCDRVIKKGTLKCLIYVLMFMYWDCVNLHDLKNSWMKGQTYGV
jgi:hypothetical protein